MTITGIQQLVADRLGSSVFEILSARRGRAQARPRQVAMWLARHTTPQTACRQIGRAFDHATTPQVIQAIRRVDERMAADAPRFSRYRQYVAGVGGMSNGDRWMPLYVADYLGRHDASDHAAAWCLRAVAHALLEERPVAE